MVSNEKKELDKLENYMGLGILAPKKEVNYKQNIIQISFNLIDTARDVALKVP